jgi:hypothetical protein
MCLSTLPADAFRQIKALAKVNATYLNKINQPTGELEPAIFHNCQMSISQIVFVRF